MHADLTRRRFLSGQIVTGAANGSAASADSASETWHVSSAVVSARAEHCAAVVARLNAIPGVEVDRVASGKIVIIIEGRSSGELGARLAEIALMDQVLSANMVYESVDLGQPGTGPDGGAG